MERVKVTIYTDPGCPFGFNAQRQEAQLLWHYGEGLDITRRMIVLAEKSSSFEERGLSREMVAANTKRLRSLYGMPMVTEPQDRLVATIQACRAYVGARIQDPPHADLLLRSLRRRAFSEGEPLDELDTIYSAGVDVGIAPETLGGWLADAHVEGALREDMAATTWRSPMWPRNSAAGRRPRQSTRSCPGRPTRLLAPRWPSFGACVSTKRGTSCGGRARSSLPRRGTATGRDAEARTPRAPDCH
jgi:predicted DsbA family dithiol-disulfide isomerase